MQIAPYLTWSQKALNSTTITNIGETNHKRPKIKTGSTLNILKYLCKQIHDPNSFNSLTKCIKITVLFVIMVLEAICNTSMFYNGCRSTFY